MWLPRYSLLLPDDGQVPKRCKNNGTGSDVICSAMGMGVSTRILFTCNRSEYYVMILFSHELMATLRPILVMGHTCMYNVQ